MPEAQAFHEVEACLNLDGVHMSGGNGIEDRIDDSTASFQHHLRTRFSWEEPLIIDWVSKPQEVQTVIVADEGI